MPHLTVITPTYNTLRFLPQCIENVSSVLTGFDFVHHVHDDGSDDLKGLAAQSGPQLVLTQAKTNEGLGSALHYLISTCPSKWCLWLNADDRLTQGARQLVSLALSHPDSAAFKGSTEFVDTSHQPIRLLANYPLSAQSVLQASIYGAPSSIIFQPSMIGSLVGLEEFTYLTDKFLMLSLLSRGNSLENISTVVTQMMRRNDQLSVTLSERTRKFEAERLCTFFPEFAKEVRGQTIRSRLQVDHRLRKLIYLSYAREVAYLVRKGADAHLQ